MQVDTRASWQSARRRFRSGLEALRNPVEVIDLAQDDDVAMERVITKVGRHESDLQAEKRHRTSKTSRPPKIQNEEMKFTVVPVWNGYEPTRMQSVLRDLFGLDRFRPGQEEVIMVSVCLPKREETICRLQAEVKTCLYSCRQVQERVYAIKYRLVWMMA